MRKSWILFIMLGSLFWSVSFVSAGPATLLITDAESSVANESVAPINVGVTIKKPFVMKNTSGGLEGFTVDLLEAINKEIGQDISLVEMNVNAFQTLKGGGVDILAGSFFL